MINTYLVGLVARLFAFLLLFPSVAFALQSEAGVLQKTVNELSNCEKASKLKIWSWVGFVNGNNEHDPKHSNGKRSTFIAHNEKVNAKIHFVIVWFHGMHGYNAGTFDGIYDYLVWLDKQNISVTFILPELPWSSNVNGIDGRYVWVKQDSFKTFYDNALAKVPKLSKSKETHVIVAGHSRGGKSIAWAAKTGGLCKVNPTWVIWSDATYGSWLQKAWEYCLKDIPVHIEIFYLRNTETQTSVKKFQLINNSTLVELIPMSYPWYHGKIGDNVLKISDVFKLFIKQ